MLFHFKMNKKNKIKIKIKKDYKEKIMDTETEKTSKSVSSADPKDEDYSWTKENDSNLINQFKRFPFEKWAKIIEKLDLKKIIFDPKKMYQETCCKVLEEDVFNNEKFLSEINIHNIDIFPNFLKEKQIVYKDSLFSAIKPDFIVNGISKAKFINIFNMKDFMFKYDKNFNKLDNIEKINIIGELKLNPDNIKNEQKNRYITFCEYANILYKKNEYFMTLYIFDISYKKFFLKNIFIDKPIILGYIPKLFKNDYLELYLKLKKEDEDNKKEIVFKESGDKTFKENEYSFRQNNEFQKNKIIENNINISINMENEYLKKIIQNNNKDNNKTFNYNDYKDKEQGDKNNQNNIDYNKMSELELLDEMRKKEDSIINKERNLEDEKIKFEYEKSKFEEEKRKIEEEKNNEIKKFEENIKLYKRSKEDLFLKKKREIENEKLELENINDLFKKKKIK